MDVLSLIKTLAAPAAVAGLTTIVAVVLLLRYLEGWRKELLTGLAFEIKRDLSTGAPEVRVSSPLVTEASDPYVKMSVCELHHTHIGGRVNDLNSRVERLERKLDDDVKRLHERVDQLPQRIFELLKPFLKD